MPAETPAQEPNPSNLFASTPAAIEVLNRLGQGLGVRKPLLLVTGESGMGKSPLVREALKSVGERAAIAWMIEPHLDAKELLPTLLGLFGGTARPGTSPLAHAEKLMMSLANATAGGRVAVLVVDDAHALADDILLELARLADRSAQRQCPLEVVLIGRPALAARLTEPALAAVADQVSLRFELPALNAHHTRRYLLLLPAPAGAERPPQFSRKACRDIHNASRGVPRDIEAIAAESARIAGRANAATVSPEHVRAAVQAIGARPAPKPMPTSRPAPVAAAAKPKHEAKKNEAPPKPARSAPAHEQAAKAPEPKVLEAEAVKPAASSAEATPSGEFVPSDDPRVKDWVARFGGSGVRLGGYYSGPVPDEPVESVAEESPAASRASRSDRVAADPTDEPVAWPPPSRAARPSPRRKGPVLGQRSASSFGWPVVALVLAIALGAVLWAQRHPVESSSHTVADSAHATPSRPQQTVTPQDAVVPQAKPLPKPAEPKTTPASQSKRAERKPAATAAQSVTRSELVAPRPKKPAAQAAKSYTIMVSSYLKKDMARAEREHLSRLTNHPVWVSTRTIDGVRTYRIILGAFESSEVAESAAQSLLQRGLIRDARILSLPLE